MFSKLKTLWTALTTSQKVDVALVVVFVLVLLTILVGLPRQTPAPSAVTLPATEHSATIIELTGVLSKQQKTLLASQEQAAQLLMEIQSLKGQVQTLTRAVATYQVTNGGAFVPVPGPSGPAGPKGDPGSPGMAQPVTPTAYRYQDWRLTFTGDTASQQATYSLNQRFEVNHVTGRRDDGSPMSLLNVFELTPDGKRIPVPTTTTTTVLNESPTKWRFAPTIQAGYAGLLPPGAYTPGAFVSLQLWKRGVSKAAEDSTWSLFSPAAVLSANVKAVGVAPIGVNLGRIPHQPLKDVWVSPLVLFTFDKTWRGGFAVSASF